jgi:hypothetical protein
MDPLARAQLVEVLGRTPDDAETMDALIIEALHNLWHAAPNGRGWDRPCAAHEA